MNASISAKKTKPITIFFTIDLFKYPIIKSQVIIHLNLLFNIKNNYTIPPEATKILHPGYKIHRIMEARVVKKDLE